MKKVCEHRAEHKNLAMGKIDYFGGLPNYSQTDSHQNVYTAQSQTTDDKLPEHDNPSRINSAFAYLFALCKNFLIISKNLDVRKYRIEDLEYCPKEGS